MSGPPQTDNPPLKTGMRRAYFASHASTLSAHTVCTPHSLYTRSALGSRNQSSLTLTKIWPSSSPSTHFVQFMHAPQIQRTRDQVGGALCFFPYRVRLSSSLVVALSARFGNVITRGVLWLFLRNGGTKPGRYFSTSGAAFQLSSAVQGSRRSSAVISLAEATAWDLGQGAALWTMVL